MKMKEIVLGLLTFALIMLFFTLVYIQAAHNPMDDVEWAQGVHIVQSGETLWDIAKMYCPATVDIRMWIYEVEKINDIEGYIYAGDEIVILEAK